MRLFGSRIGRGRSKGQALVEFAIIAPLLVLIFVGIFEAGRLIFYYHNLNNAAREGARYAIVHGENAFDGCPSGPVPFGVTACDPGANRIRARIISAATAVDPAGLSFGWPGDGAFPLYYSPLDACSSDTLPGCSSDQTNRVGNNVTLRLAYSYAPIMMSDVFGSITIRSETTLVINN